MESIHTIFAFRWTSLQSGKVLPNVRTLFVYIYLGVDWDWPLDGYQISNEITEHAKAYSSIFDYSICSVDHHELTTGNKEKYQINLFSLHIFSNEMTVLHNEKRIQFIDSFCIWWNIKQAHLKRLYGKFGYADFKSVASCSKKKKKHHTYTNIFRFFEEYTLYVCFLKNAWEIWN